MIEAARTFRHAFRSLAKNPGFSLLAIGTLALGIGANAAVFSVAHALLLRPFPFPHLERVVSILESLPAKAGSPASHEGGEGHRSLVPPGDADDLIRERGPWQSIGACGFGDFRLGGIGDPEHVAGSPVTEGFFAALGAAPELGRLFSPDEHVPGRDRVAVVSDGFWRRRLAASPAAVGSAMNLDGRAYTIVGVMPRSFAYPPGGVDVWVPWAPTPAERADRRIPTFLMVARRRPGTSLPAARARVGAVEARLRRDYPETFGGKSFLTVPLRDAHSGPMAPFVVVFEAAALFVLVIACVNVASLLLARGARRRRELAIRSALGAGRGRLIALIAAEWTLLAGAAAALALWIADAALKLIRVALPSSIAKWLPGWTAIRLETPALLFTAAVAAGVGLLFSAMPALRLRRTSLVHSLGGSGRASADPRRARTQTALVIAQVALALVLLSGAAFLLRGFRGLIGAYRDFDPDGVITMRIHLSEETRGDASRQAAFFDRVLAGLRAIPGVRAASLSKQVPADLGPFPAAGMEAEGRAAASPSERPLVDVQAISSDYFRSLRIPLRSGRDFREGDAPGSPEVAIVSEELARRLDGKGGAAGRRIRLFAGNDPGPWITIVGVASDVRQYWSDRVPRLTVYRPFRQAPNPGMFAILRSAGDPGALLAPARRAVAAVDPAQPVDEIRTMNGVVLESTAMVRIAAGLLGTTAVLALLLAAIGVGGLIAYGVAQRTKEIGIRMALGARPSEIVRLVLQQGVTLGALGLAFGAPLTFGLGRLLGSILYGVAQPDPATIVAVGAALGGIALASALVPALRASRVDPMTALREE
ncbi:MAG TPA: ABC transporter permease [Thermoanaerobaculia bacterium]|nr:ABC transporter permease [Thermoanaerobaculia bacterium]